MPLHSISIVNFTEECERVQEVSCCYFVRHDGERIVNVPSVERREFPLSFKVFFDGGRENIS